MSKQQSLLLHVPVARAELSVLAFVSERTVLAVSCVLWLLVVAMLWRERSEWHGATNTAAVAAQGARVRALYEKESSGHVLDVLITETISHNPRVKVIHDFLSADECEALIREGEGGLTPSMVIGKDGKSEASAARSSSGTFLTTHTELLRVIERRIARVTMLPVENQEAPYLLRYRVGDEYKTHPDYMATDSPAAADIVDRMGGQRVATFLMYLNDVDEGGGTRFAKGGIDVVAKRGQALFWWNTHANGTVDANSWHAGLPVVRGVKYVATCWIRESPFGRRRPSDKPVVIH